MKQLLLFLMLFISVGVFAQNFSDDFESYTAGDLLAKNSDVWTTWSGGVDGEDVTVSDVKAASGTNSVYFESTNANGGPSDIVLPFGSKLEAGNWELNMKMYIESNAYFNIQGVETIGEVFAMEFFFTELKQLGVRIDGTWRLIGDYTQNEWIDLKVVSNLTTNRWEVFINGDSQGVFNSDTYSIASIDIYPLQDSKFYIDDVSTSYEEFVATGNDMMMLDLQMNDENLVGYTTEVSGLLRNIGNETITAFDITYAYNGETVTETFSDVNIAPLDIYNFKLTNDVVFVDGTNNFTIIATNPNGGGEDSNTDNDGGSFDITGYTPNPDRAVFFEEGTGTWCQFCPRGAVFLNKMTKEYGDKFVGVAVHDKDPMTVDEYNEGFKGFDGFEGWPSAIRERVEFDGLANDRNSRNFFFNKLQESPLATLKTGAEYDEDTKVLKISVSVDALQNFNEKTKLFVVVKEDDITGTGSGYDQVNAYFQGAPLVDADGVDWATLSSPVSSTKRPYHHVARALLGTFEGTKGTPKDLATGESYVYNFDVVVADDWDFEKLSIVSVLLNHDGTVNNAKDTELASAISDGFILGVDDVFVNANVDIYPNPSTGMTFINVNLIEAADVTVELVTLTGQVVATKDFGNLSGANTLNFDNSDVSTGIYLMKINAGDSFITKKVTFIK